MVTKPIQHTRFGMNPVPVLFRPEHRTEPWRIRAQALWQSWNDRDASSPECISDSFTVRKRLHRSRTRQTRRGASCLQILPLRQILCLGSRRVIPWPKVVQLGPDFLCPLTVSGRKKRGSSCMVWLASGVSLAWNHPAKRVSSQFTTTIRLIRGHSSIG